MSNQSWKHQYFENNSNELHPNIFRSLEIEQYFEKVLKDNGFDLQNYKINFSNSEINILLSVCKLKQTNFKIYEQKRKQEKKIKFFLENHSSDLFVNKKLYALTVAKIYRQKIENEKSTLSNVNNLFNKILKSLKLFTKNKKTINLTIEETNFVNSNEKTKQILKTLFKFQRTPYYKEGKKVFTPFVTFNSAVLISNFIAIQLKNSKKQQNFLFNFIQESLKTLIHQKFSKVQGVKILIKGRINNASRSNSKIIKIGKISLISRNSNINYSESTAFTSNGTIGVKVWTSLKS